MTRAFYVYESVVKGINSLFATIASGLVLVIVFVVVASILVRGIGGSLNWANDVAQIAFVYLVFLSLGPALASGHHVTVELFEPFVPKPVRKYLDVVAALASLAFGIIFFQQVLHLTNRSFDDGRLAIAAIAIPLKWIQLAGPVGLGQFTLTAFLKLWLAQRCLSGNNSENTEV